MQRMHVRGLHTHTISSLSTVAPGLAEHAACCIMHTVELVFSYGFYFRKLTFVRKLNPNENFCSILYYMRAYHTIRKLNPNVNLKYEILSCLTFSSLRYK